ncbi:PE-PGRS family protein [Streptomyces gougerotii]|uniref:PE-PGRS family protein n=1 Tax=Streptomyces gougerotii TaxID=53448 RepID=UPI00386E3CB2|nr:PE-PGRS family protein [Streptomyces gougerotii]
MILFAQREGRGRGMSFRMANPEDLEHLAKLLDGRGGLEERLDEAFTRASQLGVSGHLTALKPMRPWARDQARDLRMRALRLRLENGDPTAGLLMAGATREDLEKAGPQISPETCLLANSVAASDDPEAEGLARRKGEMFGDWIVRLEAHALLKIPGLEIHEKTLAEMISAGSDALNVAAATQTAVGSGFSLANVQWGNSVKTGRIRPMKAGLEASWLARDRSPFLRRAGLILQKYDPPIRSLSAPGSWLPGQLGNMAGRSSLYQTTANVPFASGVLADRWGRGLDTARRNRLMNTRFLRFTPNQALNFFVGSDEIAKLHGGTTHSGQAVSRAGQASLLKVGRSGGFRAAVKTAGLWRRAGVAGSLTATGFSVANIVTMDHGKEWKKSTAGYLANYAEAGFNASLTAATVAPNPVTIGLAVGTGIVYGGLKVVERWDGVKEGAGRVGEWAAEKLDDATEGLVDGAKKISSALNPFD